MIELHTALAIAGLVVLIIVVIVSYDRYRLAKISEKESRLRGVRDADDSEPSLVSRSDFRVVPDPPQNTDQIVLSPRDEAPASAELRPELKPEFLPEADNDTAAEPVPSAPATRVPEQGAAEMEDETYAEDTRNGHVQRTAAAPLPDDQAVAADEEMEPEAADEIPAIQPDRGRDSVDQQLREAEQVAHTPIYGVAAADLSGDVPPLQIEFVARIPGKNVIKRDTALGLYRQYEFELKKPHRIFGLSYPGRAWCDMEQQPETAKFTHFGMTLQLADRSGSVSESELNQFSQMVLRFSEVFGRRFKFSASFEEAMEQARRLDVLCKKYDALAILNIVTRDVVFRGGDIERHAQELGMSLNRRKFYEKTRADENGGELLYSLANLHGNGEFLPDAMERFRTSGLTLFMNIPCTRDPGQVFNDMIQDAKELCKRLDGKMVDQNQRGMTQKGLKRIAQQIRQMASDMEADGIVPGSPLALRLF